MDAELKQTDIGKIYDKIAPVYDIWAMLTETRARDRAIELAAIQDGQSILEVAVGTGLAFYEIVKRNPSGINKGIDLSKGMLTRAERRLRTLQYANYILKTGSAFNLAMDDESVDTLINNYMFDLISFYDMDKIITEFRRVLRKKGKLVLVNMTEGERFGSQLYKFIFKISPRLIGGCRSIRMSEKLEGNGFTVAMREYYQQMLFPSEVILAYKN